MSTRTVLLEQVNVLNLMLINIGRYSTEHTLSKIAREVGISENDDQYITTVCHYNNYH